jgi:hypothetical protein
MKKQITSLVLIALFICNSGVFAQELPQITSIDMVGRGIGNPSFGHYGDYCAQESEGVFTWVGTLFYNYTNDNSANQSFKAYVNNVPGAGYNEQYQFNAIAADEGVSGLMFATVEDGGTYSVAYSEKGSDTYVADNKWRINYGGDGYYKITFNVMDPYAVTMSLKKVDITYANLGSLSVEGYALFQKDDEEKEWFDPDVYEYNCYIPADETPTGVSCFSFRNTKVTFNGESARSPFTYPVTVSDGDVSMIVVTGFDNSSSRTYTIYYKVDANGVNSNQASKAAYTVKGQALTVTGVSAYVVYAVNGTVAADVRTNAPGKSVSLLPGVYVVKTNTAETFKVVIK